MDLQGFLSDVETQAETALATGAEALGAAGRTLNVIGGKRLRSRLAFECAHALDGEAGRAAPVAAAVELIHAASLCHDDVIDGSTERRGRPTLNMTLGNQLSVLLGDYLFSSAWLVVARDYQPDVARRLAEAMVAMSSAEIAQARLLWRSDPDEEDCLRVARGKTGALFAACASATAGALGAAPAVVRAFDEFGLGFGLAYQIIDDVLDYLPRSPSWGKRPLMDLRGGLPTLPLIFALRSADGPARRAVLDFLESRGRTPLDTAGAADFIRRSGADEQCRQLARRLVERGLSALSRHATVNGLADLAHAVVGRLF
jgi:geranylgeranyl pyrophosphate synthase